MKRLRPSILPVLILSLMMGLPLDGQVKKIAQSGMKWLSIPVGARATAMGAAFTAVADDGSAVFWNPAGAAMGGSGVFLSQNQWIADIGVLAGAVTFDLGNIGVVGASYAVVNWGDLNGTVRDPSVASGYRETGTFSPTNFGVGINYARRVSDQFAFGGHLKYLYENLGSNYTGSTDTDGSGDYIDAKKYTAEMNTVAFDFGTLYYTGFHDLRLGMSLQNFSQEMQYRMEWFALPLTFKFGLAMDLLSLLGDPAAHTLTVAVDALHPRDYTERIHLGVEYRFHNLLFLRGGYKTNYDEENVSFGGGVNLSVAGFGLGVDYAFIQFGNFDPVQTFSFNFKF
ncbi:MAG: PorV/PorQ family protein [Fidelibacterota bacterium]|nr:MAG: PorV/PorQ family protein [Candidatus Neomarinimicrobiota bacterium]